MLMNDPYQAIEGISLALRMPTLIANILSDTLGFIPLIPSHKADETCMDLEELGNGEARSLSNFGDLGQSARPHFNYVRDGLWLR